MTAAIEFGQAGLAGWVLIAIATVTTELLGLAGWARVPPLGVMITACMRWSPTRWVILVAWALVGLHLFVRPPSPL